MRRFGLLALTACTGHTTDIQPTLRFRDLDVPTIVRLLDAARGAEVAKAVDTITYRDPDPCPTTSTSGDTTTYQGGCTTAKGVAITGTATITAPHDQLLHGTFDAWTVGSTTYSGTADWLDPLLGRDADLTVDIDGIAVRADLFFNCEPEPDCSNSCLVDCTPEGSGVELVGVGGALISGTWTAFTYAARAYFDTRTLTLHGADTLIADDTGWIIEP
jgi:hypothetical protein